VADEVFAWPEGRLWVYSGGAVSPAAVAFVERVRFDFNVDWARYRNLTTGEWAARSNYVKADQSVAISWGAFWSDITWLARARSATAWNLSYSAEHPIATAAIQVLSAVIPRVSLAGQMGGVFRFEGSFQALDFSASAA
jgi:hypothetical protein